MTAILSAGALDLADIAPGFRDPTLGSQAVFRRLMDAMARPGLIQDVAFAPDPPKGLNRAAGAVGLTLLDFETPLWLAPAIRAGAAADWLRFHCACPLTDSGKAAAFAILADLAGAPPLSAFNPGDAKYPDRSTTVIVQLPALEGGPIVELEGPGIKGRRTFAPQGVPDGFWAQVQANHERFQFGVDLFFTAGDRVAALPRSTRVQLQGV